MSADLSSLLTERRNPATMDVDELSTAAVLTRINREDMQVPAAVTMAVPSIARLVDAAVEVIQQGGRLIYVGAGTSGRLGLLDAYECPPTFGVDPGMVVGVLAGGDQMLVSGVEGIEDDEAQARVDLQCLGLSPLDLVVGIAASGRTPYTLAAMRYARRIGTKVGCIVNNPGTEMERLADYPVVVLCGPEVVTGSTRMKAGTCPETGAEHAFHGDHGPARQGLREPHGGRAAQQRQVAQPRAGDGVRDYGRGRRRGVPGLTALWLGEGGGIGAADWAGGRRSSSHAGRPRWPLEAGAAGRGAAGKGGEAGSATAAYPPQRAGFMATLLPGRPYPLGATFAANGVNFSVFTARATGVELLLYDRPEDVTPARTIRLDPEQNRTYYYWHVFVPGLRAGQVYAYRVSGPFAPEVGLRFDRSKVLIDPYARALYYDSYWREAAKRYGDDNSAYAMKSVVVDPAAYDWQGDVPLRRPFDNSVIYEMHVRGFTANPNSGSRAHKLGTYAGLDREDSLPAGTRHPDGGAPARAAVRSPGGACKSAQLLGVRSPWPGLRPTATTAHARIRSAPWTNFVTW